MKKSKGLTIIELLITLVVMSLIMGGLVVAFISHSRISAAEEARIDVQQNLRVATDRLKHALKHSGFGCYDTFESFDPDSENSDYAMYGNDPLNGNIEISTFISHIDNNDSFENDINNDSVIITYGFKKIGEVNWTASDVSNYEIRIKNKKSPAVTADDKFKRYLSFFPTLSANIFFKVTDVSDNGYVLKFDQNDAFDEINFKGEPDVYMVSPTRIKISESDGRPVLYFQNFAYSGAQYWIVAENIEDIKFQYYIPGQGWRNEPAENDITNQNIRKIRFWILGKSKKPVPNAGGRVFEVRDHKDNIFDNNECVEIVGDECIMYRVGPFDDGHVRMLSRGEVKLRNVF